MLAKGAGHPPRLILCEKPLRQRSRAAQAAVARNWKRPAVRSPSPAQTLDSGLTKWIGLARSGKLGRPVGANVIYSGGFWNQWRPAVGASQ